MTTSRRFGMERGDPALARNRRRVYATLILLVSPAFQKDGAARNYPLRMPDGK